MWVHSQYPSHYGLEVDMMSPLYYLLLCSNISPTFSSVNQQTFIISTSFCGTQLGSSGSGSPRRLWAEVALQSSEGWGLSVYKRFMRSVVRGCQVLATRSSPQGCSYHGTWLPQEGVMEVTHAARCGLVSDLHTVTSYSISQKQVIECSPPSTRGDYTRA